jgi:hypothetical protein
MIIRTVLQVEEQATFVKENSPKVQTQTNCKILWPLSLIGFKEPLPKNGEAWGTQEAQNEEGAKHLFQK